ncbi:uncharacterized protein LOC115456339 [Manduca sexta]|uniref:uncharacterized protein LOC115456339 n=1 Tax=Manduca sexta TaxID=7130 RepID=UPI001183DA45|nr:uncharacterized protein LOC115456339 [Manduca sexta]
MWVYAFYATTFLYVTNAVLERHYNEEAIFADVIRNISRVNNVLQELISNYEQLQKIYKSQESTDYSSDAEIDEVFKSIKKAKYDHKMNAKVNPTERPNSESFPATQMIWSEDDDDDNDADTDDESEERAKGNVVGKFPKPEAQKAKNTPIDTFENTSSESMEVIKNTSILKPNEAKIIFIDTHKKIKEITENKEASTKKKVEPTKTPKTRYKKVLKNDKVNMKARKDKLAAKTSNTIKQNNGTKSIKKIIYAEKFSPKSIWKEIIKNKPIQLEPQEEVIYNAPKKRADNYKPMGSLQSEAAKTALVIVSKSNTKDLKLKEKDTFESPEDQTLAKEVFKTNVLRQAYGDACTKVVIKKCYKACKYAGKAYCTLYKCKGAFKSKFKELSKTGCVREFVGPKSNKSDVKYRGQDDVFVDATRVRYLDAACLPYMELNHKPNIIRNNTSKTTLNDYVKTNILRDKYERACKKVSAGKCTSACNFAYSNTCNSFNCDHNKRVKFKKYCKEQCNIAYKLFSESESTDTSSVSSDTDTS